VGSFVYIHKRENGVLIGTLTRNQRRFLAVLAAIFATIGAWYFYWIAIYTVYDLLGSKIPESDILALAVIIMAICAVPSFLHGRENFIATQWHYGNPRRSARLISRLKPITATGKYVGAIASFVMVVSAVYYLVST
jgi:hypothetical protein